MKYFYSKVERRIYICSSYIELLGESAHTVVVPGVTWEQVKCNKNVSSKIRLSFMGRPGRKCDKEKIDWIIKGVYEAGLTDKYYVQLAGFDRDEFLACNPNLTKYVTDNIQFVGRLSKQECSNLLKESDFSLVIRPDTVLSKYGFSTKISEAFSYGVPVLATDTSDNRKYILDGDNGFVCGCTYEDVKALLIRVSQLTNDDIERIKDYCFNNNPLWYENYLEKFSRVVVE